MRRAALLLIAVCLLPGCARLADSRLNPGNWFGPAAGQTYTRAELPPLVQQDQRGGVVDRRPLVSQVTALRIEPASEGAIVTAQGMAPAAGAFNAQLTRVGFENGTLVYAFRAELPESGAIGQRPLTSAVTISADELPFIRAVRVVGQGNAMVASR